MTQQLPPHMKMVASIHGEMLAHKVFMDALYEVLSPTQKEQFAKQFELLAEIARNALLPRQMPEESLEGFEQEIQVLRPRL